MSFRHSIGGADAAVVRRLFHGEMEPKMRAHRMANGVDEGPPQPRTPYFFRPRRLPARAIRIAKRMDAELHNCMQMQFCRRFPINDSFSRMHRKGDLCFQLNEG